MIRYSLECRDCEAEFEAWFSTSADFDTQKLRGQLSCSNCGSVHISKQIMAPAIRSTREPDTGAGKAVESDAALAFQKFAAKARAHIAQNFDYVGDAFADKAIAISKGDTPIPGRPIWGRTTAKQREALAEKGVDTLPIHDVFVPPTPKDKAELN